MQLMDFTAALTLIQAVVQQTHEDARRGDRDARAALADWQGRTTDSVTVTRRKRQYARRSTGAMGGA